MTSISEPVEQGPKSWLLLLVFIALVVGVGGAIGILIRPGDWYAGLQKPPFNPPDWVFGPVWFTLYVLIAIAGWRTFVADRSSRAMTAWWGQMLLNWLWTPVWFGLHLMWPAFAVIAALWLLIVGFISLSWRRDDRLSALLFVPYFVWVSFAAVLNLSIALLN